jgi:nicotinamidase-related amidase
LSDKNWGNRVQTLIVVDAQNEFSPQGRRPVLNHVEALEAMRRRVDEARRFSSDQFGSVTGGHTF